MQTFHNFIGGEFAPASSGRTIDVHEPATGSVYAQVARSEQSDVDRAVMCARDAFPEWSSIGPVS